MSSRTIVRAKVELLPSDKGGRTSPLFSGYRSLLRFEGLHVDFGFELQLEPGGSNSLVPGESRFGLLSFWATEQLPVLWPGRKFEVREGVRVVGYGTIVGAEGEEVRP